MAGPATADDVLAAIEKLSRHVEALQRDTKRLAERIIPAEGEPPLNLSSEWLENIQARIARHKRDGKISFDQMYALMAAADHQLKDAEYHFAYIKGQVEAIANSAILTAEWKEWMKPYSGPSAT